MIKYSWKSLRNSREARSLISNFSWLAVLQVVSYLFPLITVPYLARVIGVDGFGHIAFASAVMVWINTVVEWGFNATATRDVARARSNHSDLSFIYSNVQYAKVFLMIVSFIVLLILIILLPKFRENWIVLIFTFLMIPGNIAFPTWFFQGMERMKYTSVLNVVSKLFFTLAIFVFIHDKDDYYLQPLLVSLGYVCAGVFAQWIILGRWHIRLVRPELKDVLSTIKGSSDVFLNTLMPNFYNSFAVMLLGFMGTPNSVGLLDAGRKFVTVGQSFINVLTQTFFPFLSRRIDKHTSYARISLAVSSFMFLVLFIGSPLIIHTFFTPDFYDSISIMRICSLGIIPICLSNVWGTGYMILQGSERKLRNITMIVSILGFALSFPCIHFLDYTGAAISITISQVILGLSITLSGMKIKHNKEQINRINREQVYE